MTSWETSVNASSVILPGKTEQAATVPDNVSKFDLHNTAPEQQHLSRTANVQKAMKLKIMTKKSSMGYSCSERMLKISAPIQVLCWMVAL
ncbi:hypothetical protein INT44_006356 [Umbelopsis vinacea]|uniref:Uncharacterized protein n=1 Tax=Umbelopsis vinacea TaxID=44442 RepID=A0A8H7UE10_9FUNG|nr:hypothetical protein INT44_006356 [Umbelopsis vinacea]